MNSQMDPRMIEADLARERAGLSSALGALRQRMSATALTDDAMGLLNGRVTQATQAVDSATRNSPVAVAMVGAGLAWLFFSKPQGQAPAAVKREAMSNWEDDGGPARPSDEMIAEGQAGYGASVRASSFIGRAIEDHPMLLGALLLGAGAALGAALPRTPAEDRVFGIKRDSLMDRVA